MTRIVAIAEITSLLKMPNETYISEYLHIAYCPIGQGETEMSKRETQKPKAQHKNGIPTGIPISVLRQTEGFRKTKKGTGDRKSLSVSLKVFLLENRGKAFSAQQLIQWADSMGFSTDAKRLEGIVNSANNRNFLQAHPTLAQKITKCWVGNERYYYIGE